MKNFMTPSEVRELASQHNLQPFSVDSVVVTEECYLFRLTDTSAVIVTATGTVGGFQGKYDL